MKVFAALILGLVVSATAARAQSGPDDGNRELQVWTGGGHGVTGSTSDTGVWNLGLRYGWVLTDAVGPRPLRGRFEYAVDAVPMFLVMQKTGTAYGFGVNPVTLKWNFATHGRISPYVELAGGTLFTNDRTPSGTSHVNFTTSAALGLNFPCGGYNCSADVRYMHISNAGLTTPNPGINTVQVRLGFGRFSHH